MDRIDAAAVIVLARTQGHDWIDAAAAERIAAGASAAMAAVRAALQDAGPGLLTTDGAAFLDELEDLADTPR